MLRSTFVFILAGLTVLLASPARAQTAGAVAAYGFSEAAGTTSADASGNGNTGTLNGATRTTAGQFGSAVTVNGSGAYVDIGNGPALQLTGSMTISAWVRAAAFPADDAAVVSKRNGGEVGFQLDTTVDTGARTIGFKLTSASGGGMFRFGGTVLQTNTWYHITGVYDAAARTLDVYLNGVLDNGVQTGTITATQQNSTLNVNIGRRAGLSGYAFNGTIDEVRIYNRALGAAEIQADMASPVGGGAPLPPDTIAPGVPGTLTATASGASQISLAWGAATDNVGVTGYRVERCQGPGCTTFLQVATPVAASFNDTALSAGTSYSYRVRAADSAGNLGGYSNVASAVTPAPDTTAPSAPPTLSATAASATQINLAWTAATDNVAVTGYRVERCAGSGCTTFAQIATPTATTLNNTGLTAGTSYSYRVRAVDAAGNLGPYSSTASTTTLAAPDTTAPTAPTGLAATAASSTQINLTWNASTDNVGVASYRVFRCLGATCTNFAQIGTSPVPGFSSTGLTPSTTYRHRVRAVDAAGNLSANSITVNATTPAAPDTVAPSAPASLVATAASATQINLTWSAVTDNVGVTGYRVERCQGAGCTTFAQIATPTGATFNNTGLAAGTSYSYRVRAADAAGNLGTYSGVASATTAQAPAPDFAAPTAPANLTATAAGNSQINLAWAASTDDVGVAGYRVERCTGSGCTTFVQITTPTGTSLTDSGLAPNSSYSYQVLATDAAGNLSGYSNIASATTTQAAGPVAAYGFSEAAGTTTADASGNGNTGTLNGATRTTAGQFGGGVTVNGSGAYVDIGNGPALQLTGSITISAWIRAAAFPADDAAVVSKRNGGETGFQLDTTVDTGARTIGFKLTNASGGGMFRFGSTVLQTNQWYHITGVYDAAARTLDVYLNGVLDNGTQAGTITAAQQNSTLNVNIGRRAGLSGYAFNGSIDEVRIYNRALGAAEIQADMASPVSGAAPPPSDAIAPSAPGTLSATATGTNQVDLAWGAATDNVGVTGYRVERCAGSGCTAFTQIATPTGTSFNDTALSADTSYSYRVRAADAAGNLGGYANVASATTPAPTPDFAAPSAPASLSATAAGSAQIELAWTASTDNVGVTGYRVERCAGSGCTAFAQIAAPTGTSFSDTGLAASTSYSYQVRAADAAGNLSPYSNVASATTSQQTSGVGTVAAYGFSEASGTATADASGNGNTGTLVGAGRTSAGQFGGAVTVSGDAFVDLGNGPALQLTASMTISAWIRAAAFPVDDAAVVSKRTSGELGFQFDTTVDTGARTIGFKLTNASGGNMFRFGSTVLQANQWYYITGVYDAVARTLNVYLNGVLDNGVLSGTITATQQNSSQDVHIGRRSGASGYAFNGTIDEVRIYNRALNAAEIQVDMATPVSGTTPPPTDTVPPAVSITAPATGATVVNAVPLSADASDDVGVASVQFLIDGAPLGSPIDRAPYSLVWDTATIASGSHVLQAMATDFAGNSTTSAPVSIAVLAPTGSSAGQWAAPVNWPIVAVHANLLPTGEVLAWDGQDDGHQGRVWNPATGAFTSVPSGLTNLFCSGHCLLPDGRVLVAGGHNGNHTGLRDTNLFNPATRLWSRVAPMAFPRWYPTATPLPDGRVLVTSGETDCGGCFVPIPEIYDPEADSWTQLTGASMSFPYYPHMFVLPDGRVLAAATTEDAIVSRVLDIPTQTWSVVDPNAVDGGSSVMYAPGKIMKSGRSVDPDQPVIPATATTYVLDMNQPTPQWRPTASMTFARTYHTLTLLPDGTVLATGGGPNTDAIGVNNAVLSAELWSPATETWTTLASMQSPRLYHSTALLLPDARVLVTGGGRFNGGGIRPTDQLNSEIFSPPYLFKGPRPVIASAPSTATYGASIGVQTPDAARIGSVSLIRLGAVTHGFNMNQKIVPLQFTAGAGSLSVQAPANANLAPPGHYMLFILDASGVPSVASIVQLR